MCYRIYFRGDELNTSFPAPRPPKDLYVAADKPASMSNATTPSSAAISAVASLASAPAASSIAKLKAPPGAAVDSNGEKKVFSPDDRRLVLNEVRDHLELLKEFDGIIPAEDIVKRKRELFLAMPPAPPPAPKRAKKGSDDDSK
jgi:hypothetical protein